jgi:hypothetical protein
MSDRKFVSIALTMETRDAYATVAKIAAYIGGDQGEYVADDGHAMWHAEAMTLRVDVQVVDEDIHFAIDEALDYFNTTLEAVDAPGFIDAGNNGLTPHQLDTRPHPFSISVTDTELLTRNLLGLTGNTGGESRDDFDDDEGLPQEAPDPWGDDDSGQLVLAGTAHYIEEDAA